MGADRRIALRRVERRREIARPLPGQNGAGDRHRVAPIVAGMIDRDHDIAMPRQGRSEPRHDPRRAAEAVRQQDHRARAGVLESGVGRGGAGREKRLAGRTDVERRFDRVGRGRIPDRDSEFVAVRGVAQRGRRLMRDEMALADRRGCGGSAATRPKASPKSFREPRSHGFATPASGSRELTDRLGARETVSP